MEGYTPPPLLERDMKQDIFPNQSPSTPQRMSGGRGLGEEVIQPDQLADVATLLLGVRKGKQSVGQPGVLSEPLLGNQLRCFTSLFALG